ncbi:MAG: hypothetical protein HGB12_11285, partial [Bacteroidetes bacterium]|nr:hypothetical protein [Bacteroidota bacterium]
MKIEIFKLKLVLILFICTFIQIDVNAQKNKDSTSYKNSIKIDLLPLYYDFFDTRMQIRTGIEYERNIKPDFFAACFLDIGLFDNYVFKKYYDFFIQNQGFYSVEQKASIMGFHFMPSYNYYIFKSKNKQKQGIYFSVIMDVNYYLKNIEIYNSKTEVKTSNKFSQLRYGVGFNLGAKYAFGSHFFAEMKTSLLTKIFIIRNYIE